MGIKPLKWLTEALNALRDDTPPRPSPTHVTLLLQEIARITPAIFFVYVNPAHLGLLRLFYLRLRGIFNYVACDW